VIDTNSDAEALFWLGRGDVRAEERRVTIPDAAFELDLFDPDERVFWAADPDLPAAFLSNREDLFEDDDDALLAGEEEVHTSGAPTASDEVDVRSEVTVPTMLFGSEGAGGEAPSSIFEPGTTVHFLTNPDLLAAGVCMAAPDAVVRELFEVRLRGSA
jgi:hypothetical protein